MARMEEWTKEKTATTCGWVLRYTLHDSTGLGGSRKRCTALDKTMELELPQEQRRNSCNADNNRNDT